MRSVIAVHRIYADESEFLMGLFDSEIGARTRVYAEVTRWEGRLLWWPLADGRWVAQLLVRDFLNGGKYKMFATKWEIGSLEIQS